LVGLIVCYYLVGLFDCLLLFGWFV